MGGTLARLHERAARERPPCTLSLPLFPLSSFLSLSPPPELLVEPLGVVPHPLRQLGAAQDALHSVDRHAVDEQQQRRQRSDAEAGGDCRVSVGVDLDDLHVSRHAVGAVLLMFGVAFGDPRSREKGKAGQVKRRNGAERSEKARKKKRNSLCLLFPLSRTKEKRGLEKNIHAHLDILAHELARPAPVGVKVDQDRDRGLEWICE